MTRALVLAGNVGYERRSTFHFKSKIVSTATMVTAVYNKCREVAIVERIKRGSLSPVDIKSYLL